MVEEETEDVCLLPGLIRLGGRGFSSVSMRRNELPALLALLLLLVLVVVEEERREEEEDEVDTPECSRDGGVAEVGVETTPTT